MGMGAQRARGGALKTARGTGRKVTPVVTDANDPLHGVRKKMPYEKLVKELENNPEAEIRRYKALIEKILRLFLKGNGKPAIYEHSLYFTDPFKIFNLII
jgi:hypothetical protein